MNVSVLTSLAIKNLFSEMTFNNKILSARHEDHHKNEASKIHNENLPAYVALAKLPNVEVAPRACKRKQDGFSYRAKEYVVVAVVKIAKNQKKWVMRFVCIVTC